MPDRIVFKIYAAPKPGQIVGDWLCMGSRSAEEVKPAAQAATKKE